MGAARCSSAVAWALVAGGIILVAGDCADHQAVPADRDADVDAEADGDMDRASDADDDRSSDADVDARPDAEVDGEADRDGDDSTWVLHWPIDWPMEGVVRVAEVLSDGGVLAAGELEATAWIARLAADGTEVWSRAFGPLAGRVTGAVETGEGRLFVVAWMSARWLAELDPRSGEVLWQTYVDSEPIRTLDELWLLALGDGSLVVGARAPLRGVELARLTPEEGILWRRRLADEGWQQGDMAATADGTVVVAGLTTDGGGVARAVLTELDAEGRLVRSHELRGEVEAIAGASATPEGGLALAGAAGGFWVARLDRSWSPEWSIAWGRPWEYDRPCEGSLGCPDVARSVAAGPAGEVLAVGIAARRDPPYGEYGRWDILAVRASAGAAEVRMAVLNEPDPRSLAQGRVAAVGPDGRWLVGGSYHAEHTAVLASLDGEGGLGRPCDEVGEAYLLASDLPIALLPFEPRIEEGTLALRTAAVVQVSAPASLELGCE